MLRAFFMQHQRWCCLFLHGCVTYLLEYQRDNYLCLLQMAAGIDVYVTER